MKNLVLALMLCISFANTSSATQLNGSMQRSPNMENCDIALKLCSYNVINLSSAADLKSKILPIMFPGPTINPAVGFIREDHQNKKELRYWFEDDTLRQNFLSLARRLDRFEVFTPSPLVILTTEIFAVTDEGLTNFQASLGGGFGDAVSGNVGSAQTDPGLSLSVAVGDWQISAALTAGRTKNYIEKLTTIKQIVPNHENIDFNQTTRVFGSPTPGIQAEQEAGLKIDGQISIIETPELGRQILIKNLSFYYGVEEESGVVGEVPRVNVLKLDRSAMLLNEGFSRVMISSNSYTVSRRMSIGFPTSVNNSTRATKLVVVKRAKAVSYEDYVAEVRSIENMSISRRFTPEQVDEFPTTPVKMKDVATTLIPYIKLTTDGERIMGFKLSKELARRDNYLKTMKIKVRAKGYKKDYVKSIEKLMLTGIKLEDLPDSLFREPSFRIKVRMKEFKKRGFYKYRSNLYFNPVDNEFIQ